jgi:quercetin dioxygenase-like cupin family protein
MPSKALSWRTATLIVVIGALGAAALVALVLPKDATLPGFSGKEIVRGTLPESLNMKVDGASDVQIAKLSFAPGASGGWHEHHGYVLVSVLSGTATFYDAGDPACTPHRYSPGDSVLEYPNHPHITRNEGEAPLVLYVVAVTPQGKDSDASVPASSFCRFSSPG